MVRSMYSGVAGMKANQTRMDVIGNNISNANTYGFKSSRATFRDMYYQQLRGASAGTQIRGGINPSMVGYGSQISSVDLLMTQSAMTSTGNPLDICITGEGFIQVQDPDGNIYYTKAGMLDIDPNTGYVIDSNGNFVLGTSASNGKLDSMEAGKDKIKIQVDPVQAGKAELVAKIGGKTLSISSTNMNKAANVGFTFTKSTEMPDGKRVSAVMDSMSSVINIQLNANETFNSMSDLQGAINNAITEAYGGPHPGGEYQFSIDPDPFKGGVVLTGAQIVNTAAAEFEGGEIKVNAGTGDVAADGSFLGGFKIKETGLKFSGNGQADCKVSHEPANLPTNPERYLVEMTINGEVYKGYINKDRADASSGGQSVMLSKDGGDPNDTITLTYPNSTKIQEAVDKGGTVTNIGNATPSQPTKNLGLGKGTFTLSGGTEFTEQDIGNLTGISVGADGTIMGTSAAGLQVLGRIDLATFGNAKGLMQSGSTYFTETANSGKPKLAIAGEDGTGAIKNSALEMSNVDLSQEFSDMITTQRGFQACSRLITVSDTMLEELINLKR